MTDLKDKFHSPKCLETYLYAKSKAEQINKYLEQGYLVLEDGKQFKNPFFLFDNSGEPTIAVRNSENSVSVYLCDSWDEDGRIWIYEESDKEPEDKEYVNKLFNGFTIVNPKHIIRI